MMDQPLLEIPAASSSLIPPCGGRLVDLTLAEEACQELSCYAKQLPSVQISERSTCDLELLATGAFSPLDRFMGKADFDRVLEEMRLASGHLFPIPVTLPVERGNALSLDRDVALRDSKNQLLAVMTVEEIYEWDLARVAQAVFKTSDPRHPLVAEMHRWGPLHVSGPLRMLALPARPDFQELRLTPRQVRQRLCLAGRPNVVAFQTRNPLHRVHEEIMKRAIESVDGVLLLHPAVGMTKPGDIDHYTRVRTYKAVAARYFDRSRVVLALLPLAMRLAGPREALWHALIRRNYGANHLIVGRDHASPGGDSTGRPFYPPEEAGELVQQFSQELGVGVIPFGSYVYLPGEDRYEEASRVAPGIPQHSVSGSEVREDYLAEGKRLPEWLARPEVADILAEAYPPAHRRGVCIWFTGLSGAGKSTTAEVLTSLLLEHGRQVTVLDGDVVRTNFSKGLDFSKAGRDTNIRRIGFVASEIVRHGGVVIAAAVSPYRAARNDVRSMVGEEQFVEVYVNTPLEVCESRDAKGMYARARRGEIKEFTGIDDPYEPPLNPEITLDTLAHSPEENARTILDYLLQRRFLRREAAPELVPEGMARCS